MTSESITLLAWTGPILVILGIILLIAHPRIQKGLALNSNKFWLVFGNLRPVNPNFNTVKSLAYICLIVGIFCIFISIIA